MSGKDQRGAAGQRGGFTLLEQVAVLAIISVLVSLLLPAIARLRASAQACRCLNNLRQIGIALQSYHALHSHFPPGVGTAQRQSRQPYLTWLARLLPHLENEALWQRASQAFEKDRFFQRPGHLSILGHSMSQFVCPADGRSAEPWAYVQFRVAFTDYLGVEGTNLTTLDGVLFQDSRVSLAAVLDGTSNTLIVGERPPSMDHSLGWWYAGWGQRKTGSADSVLGTREIRVHPRFSECPRGPYQFHAPVTQSKCDAFHFWSFHPGGAHFAFCDGSVRFLAYSADPIMPALATRAGGEAVTID